MAITVSELNRGKLRAVVIFGLSRGVSIVIDGNNDSCCISQGYSRPISKLWIEATRPSPVEVGADNLANSFLTYSCSFSDL
jgi:hypothetical protein